MRIALIGYGKMGKLIDEIVSKKGHDVVLKISSANRDQLTPENLKQADVAIEFTNPESAFENVMTCLQAGIPVVCGSTGWNDRLDEAKHYATQNNVGFLHASNFSIGVNLFFEVNKMLAKMMAGQPQYRPEMKEVHHTQKKDAPSGTAVTLAEQILEANSNLKQWVKGATTDKASLPIDSERTDPAPGTHHVKYTSAIDDIEIIHTAHSREGFAAGAVAAAEFLVGKKGVYTMSDVLQLKG